MTVHPVSAVTNPAVSAVTKTVTVSYDDPVKNNSVQSCADTIFRELQPVLFPSNKNNLRTWFKNPVNQNFIRTILEYIFRKAISDPQYDQNKILSNLAEVVNFDSETALQKLEDDTDYAQDYIEATEEVALPLSVKIEKVCHALVGTLENVVNVIGLADVLKPNETSTLASMKMNRIFVLFMFVGTIYGFAAAAGGAVVGVGVTGGFLGLIIGLTVLFAYLPPHQVPFEGKNWTLQYHFGQRPRIDAMGRSEEQARMASRLKVKGQRQHVALIGESGVGKTFTAESFAQSCARCTDPKSDLYQLKDKIFICFNSTELLNRNCAFERVDVLGTIKKAISYDPDRYILVFDEFHAAVKEGPNSLGDAFKLFLDSVPHAIILTTEIEYKRFVEPDAALIDRFGRDPIRIESTEPADTADVLHQRILREAPRAIEDNPQVLSRLITLSERVFPGSVQPGKAGEILGLCLTQIKEGDQSNLQDEIIALEAQMRQLKKRKSRGIVIPLEEIKEVEKRLDEKRKLAKVKSKENINDVRESLARLVEVKKKMHKAVLRRDVTLYMLSKIYVPILEEQIKTRSRALGVKTVIDDQLVNEVIAIKAQKPIAEIQQLRQQLNAG